MTKNKIYDELLSQLETWHEALATEGPDLVEDIHTEMREYYDRKVDEEFDRLKRELDQKTALRFFEPKPIDFNHQKNYD